MPAMSVLIADPDPIIRQCLRHALSKNPHLHIRWEAENGLQALAMAHQFQPRLLLIDSQIGRMCGIETTRCLRRSNPSVLIVVMSALERDRALALSAGADAFFVKDGGCEAILAVFDNLLAQVVCQPEDDM